jgi:HIRAN domain
MKSMNKVYVAWRNPETTSWHPIGLLSESEGIYVFEYLEGARQANGFLPLNEFPELGKRYESKSLFPVFHNRLMVQGRPDYPRYLQWLGLNAAQGGSLAELAASGGQRFGDFFEIFSVPEIPENDRYQAVFFLHGLRHQSDEVQNRITKLHVGDPLRLEPENNNSYDPCAHLIKFGNDKIGYVPRYLSCDIAALNTNASGGLTASLTIEAINEEAPLSHKILCRFSAPWPVNFAPLSGPDFQSILQATHRWLI